MSAADALAVSLDASAIPERLTGAGVYVRELARALSADGGCALSVVTRRDDVSRWRTAAPAARVVGAAPSSRPLRVIWEQTAMGHALGTLCDPAIAVHHGPHYTMPGGARMPCVVTIHDLTLLEHPEWHERAKVAFFGRAIASSVRRAAVLICVSGRTADRLRARFSPRCPVVVVPHGVDHRRFTARAAMPGADFAVLARLGVEVPYVLHLGTAEPRKGVATLLAACQRLATAERGLSVVLAGERGWGSVAGDPGPRAARVHRLGYVADGDVAPLLRQAAAFAYPSDDEGFGLPVLEALACATPVVTTTPVGDAIGLSGAAALVPPGDPVALAEALESLLAGGEAVARQRVRGLEVAAAHSWEASAAGHLAAYRAAAGR